MSKMDGKRERQDLGALEDLLGLGEGHFREREPSGYRLCLLFGEGELALPDHAK